MKYVKLLVVFALFSASVAFASGANAQDGTDEVPIADPEQAQGGAPVPVVSSPPDITLSGVLPGLTAGPDVLDALTPAELAEAAQQNGQTVEALSQTLANDSAAHLSADGILIMVDVFEVGADVHIGEDGQHEEPEVAAGGVAAGPFPNSQTFLLHSRPGSSKVIYLDFDGYNLPAGTGWNGGNALTALPWDTDGNGASFSQSELDTIQSVWQRTAEDFAAFDVDVTTEDPGYAAINRASLADQNFGTRVVITDTAGLPGDCTYGPTGGCGGIAAVGTFDWIGANHDFAQPAWAFPGNPAYGDSAKGITAIAPHEAGHVLGLTHDGQGADEYYLGHDMWAPIMGIELYEPVSQWSAGGYVGATNAQDDYAVMASHGLAALADEAGGSVASTQDVVEGQDYLIGATPAGDIDSLRYIAPCSGPFTFNANPASVSPNLSLLTQIYGPGGVFLQQQANSPVRVSNDLATGMGETMTETLVAGQAYTIVVFPFANGDPFGAPPTGFDNYGNIGRYSWDITEPGGCNPTNDLWHFADPLGGPTATVTGSNAGYTAEVGELFYCTSPGGVGTGNSAWWTWTAPASGSVTMDTNGSDFDTHIAIYTGADLNSEVIVACDNNSGLDGLDSSVTFSAAVGTTYHVQVDGIANETGNIVLTTRGCLPSTHNDDFSCANTIGGPSDTVTGSNAGFTNQVGEPDPSCDFGSPNSSSAWWSWTAPSTGPVTFDTIGSAFDTVLSVYTGNAVDALTEVACDDQGGSQASVNSSLLTFQATAGTTYHLRVDGFFGQTGNITLNSRPAPHIRPFGTVVAEGTGGANTANPVIQMHDGTGTAYSFPVDVTVNFATGDIPANPLVAHPVSDFVATSGNITIPAGATEVTFPVSIVTDSVAEPPLLYGEWGVFTLNSPSPNAVIDVASFFGLGIIIIVDDD
ncbi:MAG: hypothetical protein HKN26_00870 [Acidimicrobiales bacterium]|nr:hypothetical protein [Acidimicrobiales bacterium]